METGPGIFARESAGDESNRVRPEPARIEALLIEPLWFRPLPDQARLAQSFRADCELENCEL